MPDIDKGQHAPLNVTQQAKHRIYVGLSWDPGAQTGFLHRLKLMIGSKKKNHDLDLTCFAFDAQNTLAEHIGADNEHAASLSGHIYHSGDDPDGSGEGDDEQISAELKNLPAEIHHLIFAVAIKSGHTFDEVTAPEIRLADGYSNHVFLAETLTGPAAAGKTAFLFAHIYRQGAGWRVHNISEFVDPPEQGGWKNILEKYLV
jgi:stress response protein SCP2